MLGSQKPTHHHPKEHEYEELRPAVPMQARAATAMPQLKGSDRHAGHPQQAQAADVHEGAHTLIWHRAAGSCPGSPAQGHFPAWSPASVTDCQEGLVSVVLQGSAWLHLAREPSIAHFAWGVVVSKHCMDCSDTVSSYRPHRSSTASLCYHKQMSCSRSRLDPHIKPIRSFAVIPWAKSMKHKCSA